MGKSGFSRIVYLAILLLGHPSFFFGEMVNLESLLEKTETQFKWDPYRKIGQLYSRDDTVVFGARDPWMVANQRYVFPATIKIDKEGTLLFSLETANQIEEIFRGFPTAKQKKPHSPVKKEKLSSPITPKKKPYRVTTILIDPGHGGRDPGALGSVVVNGKNLLLKEKDLALKASLMLGEFLKKAYPKKKISFTRETDIYPTLEDRVAQANSFKQGPYETMIFISVHINASLNKKASGYEVWYIPPDYRRRLLSPNLPNRRVSSVLNTLLEEELSLEGRWLAERILKHMELQIGSRSINRGLKEESWFVVRNSRMAAVLLELGFISNRKEAAMLNQEGYLRKIVVGVYNGVREFVDFYEERDRAE